ncbi:hypothetical protein V3C99_009985, partial [Haemonchus contortus]
MLLESPPPSKETFLCHSPTRSKTYQATFSTTRMTRIPRRRSSGIYPPGFQVMRPRLVTARNTPVDDIEKSSTIYQYSKTKTYFEQCFKIVRQLGRGVFGEALEVENLEDGKRYAIKRALHTFESSGDRRQKLHEAMLHESIPAHQNIVRYEKAWEERGRLYIQTELCRSNLADYRRCFGILRMNELYTVLLDVLQAINHMHSMGLLHMDVKPSNIFISTEGTSCKLGDFGLAFNLNEDSMDSAQEGDKYYMAPEILNNPPTTAADVYSLGITLLELSTNVDLENDKELIRDGKVPNAWFGEIDQNLTDIIKSMLEPNALKRPSTKGLLEALRLLQLQSTCFREMEVPRMNRHLGTEDKDWDIDSEEEDNVRNRFHMTTIKNVRLRLNFDSDDFSETPKEVKPTTPHPLRIFCRRLIEDDDSEDQNTKSMKRRRL